MIYHAFQVLVLYLDLLEAMVESVSSDYHSKRSKDLEHQWHSQDCWSTGGQNIKGGGGTQTRQKLNEETSKMCTYIVAPIKFCLIVHYKVQQNVELKK